MTVEEGWQALGVADWQRAQTAFESALATEETAAALDGLGVAVWFQGELEEGIALRQRAFERYAAGGECSTAARVGVWISRQYLISGRAAAADGWLARAERAAEGSPGCAGEGWVAVEHARRVATVTEASAEGRRALELAQQEGDSDLEVFALSVLGRVEVAAGLVDNGFRHLDEAMAAATAGRVSSMHTLGEAYCNLIIASTSAGDWERAAEWCDHVDAFSQELGVTVLTGVCRTVHADVLAASGRWSEAEQALGEALDAHRQRYPVMTAAPAARLALLRIRQGRLAEASQLLAGPGESRDELLARAELRRAEGEPATAVVLLERSVAAAAGDVMAEARSLGPLVDALLALGEQERAASVVDRLDELAERSGRPLVTAIAALAEARVAATNAPRDARAAATSALELFATLGMPYDEADARLELARLLADEVPQLAREEGRVAFETFKQLGAGRGMDAAAALLRELGAPVGGGPRGYGELTAREREVLALVAEGMTNARIAKALFISEKTAGHHVSRILSKLGVRNRAEAAAQANRELN
ncbi:MAG TPA: LuxR C-terminal-related transcriptional regulator [Gaiellaceae bacterium]|nr:LuxR C-terminal-related transcriptional regulator [Gaiellaceae bacterium]